ncbi:sensor histidine kinase [Streptomyces malaysiensis]|uniref:sensor histidine kinase n=1 Tax=Streptomyces malaysiensis TaxID=92644 RepID=UPI000BFD2D4F|nr:MULTISPECIES: histidine kinase [Streptomyces]ATL82371.1 two-component system sensor kinase [Streptomyces malaysiensis]MCC4320988.1 histidine kinase [Streptomyces malaysiensis]MCM3811692.1 histidine kinase [Streptomyces sp. DR7-3]QDL73304.1 sensor histidine kinase [Streptomyces malaysiensis]WPB93684.1 histidine kinase [Streptomyces malaysiensis]
MKGRRALTACVRGFAVSWLALVSIILSVLTILSICFIPLGVGVFTTPPLIRAVRAHANQRRLLAATWADVRIQLPYRPLPADRRSGVTGQVELCTLLLKDPATWRDLLWLQIDMTAGYVIALLAFAFMPYGLEGFVLAAGVWQPIVDAGGTYWYAFLPIDSQWTALLAVPVGAGFIAAGTAVSPLLLRGHFLLSRAFLDPTPHMQLEQRVRRLTETRHDAVDTSAAELRRIERDLHDGAQARLVAMGMSLGTVEALIERDPAKAKELLAAARTNSAEALAELRDLVRGIHPPVLAERGLGDAVRALTLRMAVDVEVDVDLAGRPEEPVESAAYFAISEVLTNAAKHAGASRMWLDLHHEDGMLRIAVTDDGHGGAEITPGGGLSGVERRLGTFDGVLAVSSPTGGPTMVTMEIPCTLSARGAAR